MFITPAYSQFDPILTVTSQSSHRWLIHDGILPQPALVTADSPGESGQPVASRSGGISQSQQASQPRDLSEDAGTFKPKN